MGIFKFWGSMWRVKTVTKFKNSFFSVLIYWSDNRIHLGIIKKLNFPIWFPPLVTATPPLLQQLWQLHTGTMCIWHSQAQNLLSWCCSSRLRQVYTKSCNYKIANNLDYVQTSRCVHIHYVQTRHCVHIVYVQTSHSVHIHYVQTRPTFSKCCNHIHNQKKTSTAISANCNMCT